MAKKYSKAKDGNKQLSTNFKVREFACKDGSDAILIDDELVKLLQKIRDHFGKPVVINSAYRNASYNAKIGGATKSQHINGTASDIHINGIKPEDIAKYAEHLMPNKGGIGLYVDFTHVDVRANRSRWKSLNNRETSVSGFPGYVEPKKEIESANDIIWQLMNGNLKVEITDVSKAVAELEKAKQNNSSLYWILKKIANK